MAHKISWYCFWFLLGILLGMWWHNCSLTGIPLKLPVMIEADIPLVSPQEEFPEHRIVFVPLNVTGCLRFKSGFLCECQGCEAPATFVPGFLDPDQVVFYLKLKNLEEHR